MQFTLKVFSLVTIENERAIILGPCDVTFPCPFGVENRQLFSRVCARSIATSVKGPLDDAALGKHFSIMHHRYSQSSMLLKHTANSPILDWCCMLQQHATRHFNVSHLRAQVERVGVAIMTDSIKRNCLASD